MDKFTDLIARSYKEYMNVKNGNVAHFYLYEYNIFGYGSDSKVIYSKEVFFKKLINSIEFCINDSHCNDDHLKKFYSMIEFEPNFKDYEKQLMKKQQDYYNENGLNLKAKPLDWEKCSDAKTLTEAFQNGLRLKEPVKFITLNNGSNPDTLVIRKSLLQHLKSEAIRANKASNIDDLDNLFPCSSTSNNDYPIHKDESISNIANANKKVINKALEIIKPLGGIYNTDVLLDSVNINRLNEYVTQLIMSGKLPKDPLPFPVLKISNQFIKKTIHMAYKSIGTKHKDEFIKLVHLFEQFKNTEPTTTNSKFSTYEGTYKEILDKINL